MGYDALKHCARRKGMFRTFLFLGIICVVSSVFTFVSCMGFALFVFFFQPHGKTREDKIQYVLKSEIDKEAIWFLPWLVIRIVFNLGLHLMMFVWLVVLNGQPRGWMLPVMLVSIVLAFRAGLYGMYSAYAIATEYVEGNKRIIYLFRGSLVVIGVSAWDDIVVCRKLLQRALKSFTPAHGVPKPRTDMEHTFQKSGHYFVGLVVTDGHDYEVDNKYYLVKNAFSEESRVSIVGLQSHAWLEAELAKKGQSLYVNGYSFRGRYKISHLVIFDGMPKDQTLNQLREMGIKTVVCDPEVALFAADKVLNRMPDSSHDRHAQEFQQELAFTVSTLFRVEDLPDYEEMKEAGVSMQNGVRVDSADVLESNGHSC